MVPMRITIDNYELTIYKGPFRFTIDPLPASIAGGGSHSVWSWLIYFQLISVD